MPGKGKDNLKRKERHKYKIKMLKKEKNIQETQFLKLAQCVGNRTT